MSVEIAWEQNILVTDFQLLKSLLVVLGFGSQAFVCGFSRQNINSEYQVPKCNSLPAWSKHPTLTIIETMTYPIEHVTFPEVTLCPQNSNPDRWGPTIKIFDHLERRCPYDQ